MFALKEFNIDGEEAFMSEGVFSGIYVLEGEGTLDGEKIKGGSQFFIGASCKDFKIKGKLRLIRFYGPKED